jgi:AraC-like DNA-binding protein
VTTKTSQVSTFLVRAVVDVVARAGLDRERLMNLASIDPARLDDLTQGFTFSEFAELAEKAIDATGDDALGLHVAELSSEAAFDVLAHLASHAPTLRNAISLCVQFHRLLIEGSAVVLREHGSSASLRIEFPRSTARADRMFAELALGGFVRLVRTFVGPDAPILVVSFEHPPPARPAHDRAYTHAFGGAARFSQDHTGIEVPCELLDRPQLHQHPELYSVLHSQAAAKLDRLVHGERFADRVKTHLMALPSSRLTDMASVARDLALSERSLRRHLADEGVSYRSLVQTVLETRATQMLSDPNRSIQETAHAMGFSDVASFQRAFKRWKGITPGEYKRGKT